MSTSRNRRRALYAAAPLTILLLSAAPAAALPYPPELPGDTEMSSPPDDNGPDDNGSDGDTAVLGTKTGSAVTGTDGRTAVLGTKTQNSQLALTGSDVLPYLAGGLVLVAGGAGLFVVARRRGPEEARG